MDETQRVRKLCDCLFSLYEQTIIQLGYPKQWQRITAIVLSIGLIENIKSEIYALTNLQFVECHPTTTDALVDYPV